MASWNVSGDIDVSHASRPLIQPYLSKTGAFFFLAPEQELISPQFQRPPYQNRYKPWPIALYQAAMLNVIFGIYCGVCVAC